MRTADDDAEETMPTTEWPRTPRRTDMPARTVAADRPATATQTEQEEQQQQNAGEIETTDHTGLGLEVASIRRQVRAAQRTIARLERLRLRLRSAHADGLGLGRDDDRVSERMACLQQVLESRLTRVDRALAARDDLRVVQDAQHGLPLARVNLVPLFASLVAEFRASAPPSFRVNLAVPQGLTLYTDPGRLASVLRCVFADARRRNPRGCWIDLDLHRPLGRLAHIGVRDYGRALSDREQNHLPHGRSPDADWLRLQALVTRLGGTLACDAPTDGGLRIGIDLPISGPRSHDRSAY